MPKARHPAGGQWAKRGRGRVGRPVLRPDEPTAGKPDGSLGRFAIRPANSYLSAIAVVELRYG
jgi:hypothetical protein